jgi:hypothetical protein
MATILKATERTDTPRDPRPLLVGANITAEYIRDKRDWRGPGRLVLFVRQIGSEICREMTRTIASLTFWKGYNLMTFKRSRISRPSRFQWAPGNQAGIYFTVKEHQHNKTQRLQGIALSNHAKIRN